jgi:predicted component of type VI protein secretion system
MAFSLRIPPALEADARARCERLGISLNSLLCVALDAYLRAPSEPASDGRAAPGLVSVSTSCRTSEAPSPGPAPVLELVPAPAPPVPRQKPVLTAPPVPAPEPAAVAPAPALDRAERRRLERLAKKKR